MALVPFYEANLSIYTPSGSIYGLISSDANELLRFLTDYDSEGAALNLCVRYTPDSELEVISVDEDVHKEIRKWQLSL